MNVEKFIRILGYIVYTMLWLPIIALLLVILPVMWLIMGLRMGLTATDCVKAYIRGLKMGVLHDVEFIRTGKWL